MKTILMPLSNSFPVRNVLRTETYSVLLSDPDVRLILLAPRDKKSYYEREFSHPRVVFDELPNLSSRRQDKIFKVIEYSSIHSHTATILHWWELKRIGTHMGIFYRYLLFAYRRILWWLGQFAFWRKTIRRIYYTLPSNELGDVFNRYQPDLVFAPTLHLGESYLLKEAKKRGIPTAGMVLSWDNFYSKTLLRVHPDYLIVHTPHIRDQAVSFGDYDRKRIVVTGIPQYDRSFRKEGIVARDEFLRSLEGDPAKKTIVYAFSGKAVLDREFDMLDILYKAMKTGDIKANVQVLARPYPRYDFPEGRLKKIREEYGFLAKPAMAHVGTSHNDNWEFDESSLHLQTNTLAHADVIVTMFSTFFIEGAVFDKPLIAPCFDGYREFDYYNSARRFFDWDHLREIKPLGGIRLVSNAKEFIEAINVYLENPRLDEEGRRRMVEQQCFYTDGESGRRVAQALLGMI